MDIRDIFKAMLFLRLGFSCHQSQLLKPQKRNLSWTGFRISSSRNSFTPGSSESLALRIQGSGYTSIIAQGRILFSQPVLSYTQVFQFMESLNWVSGLIPPGHLHPRPSQRARVLLEWFTPPQRSDQSVLAIPLWHWQDLLFLTSGILIRPLQAEKTLL